MCDLFPPIPASLILSSHKYGSKTRHNTVIHVSVMVTEAVAVRTFDVNNLYYYGSSAYFCPGIYLPYRSSVNE